MGGRRRGGEEGGREGSIIALILSWLLIYVTLHRKVLHTKLKQRVSIPVSIIMNGSQRRLERASYLND